MGVIFVTDEELDTLHRLVYEEITNVSYWAALPEDDRREAPAMKRKLEELINKIDFERGKAARHEALRGWQVQVLQEDPGDSSAPS